MLNMIFGRGTLLAAEAKETSRGFKYVRLKVSVAPETEDRDPQTVWITAWASHYALAKGAKVGTTIAYAGWYSTRTWNDKVERNISIRNLQEVVPIPDTPDPDPWSLVLLTGRVSATPKTGKLQNGKLWASFALSIEGFKNSGSHWHQVQFISSDENRMKLLLTEVTADSVVSVQGVPRWSRQSADGGEDTYLPIILAEEVWGTGKVRDIEPEVAEAKALEDTHAALQESQIVDEPDF